MAKLSAVLERAICMRRAGERSSEPTGPASQRSLFTDVARPSTALTCTDSYCAQPTPYHEPCAAPPSSAPTPVACIALAITDDRHRSALLDPQAFRGEQCASSFGLPRTVGYAQVASPGSEVALGPAARTR